MILKPLKYATLAVLGLGLVGGALFGREAFSYVHSSARAVRMAVKESVPVEFQLRRARDLVSDIVPEMHANIRLIAQQEVEIEALKSDIDQSGQQLAEARTRVTRLREALTTQQTSFNFGHLIYTREQVKQDLSNRFAMLRDAELVLTGKQKLLENRQRSLTSAMQALEKTRAQKSTLESQIAMLESQNQLLRTAAIGTNVQIDNSKLAQSEKLIREIKEQLDVSERVLAHESKFVEAIDVDVVNEADLLTQVDEHLGLTPEVRTETAQR
jgi:chromosome segregation ATPase